MAKPFLCTICDKSFVKESSLEEHILNKHVEDKAFKCTECFETKQLTNFFATQHILEKHIKRVHSPHSFKCQVCFKTYKDSSNFAKHKRSHFQEKKLKCNGLHCSKAFHFNHELQSHLFHVHKQRREDASYFKCEVCSRKFVNRSALELHVIGQHVLDKAFDCPICSKTFINQETLEKHIKGHDRQNKYFCDVCSQGYKTKTSLVHHLGVTHNHFFYCNKKCLRSFKNKLHFDAHNSDSKQGLQCYICQELINSDCNLKIHTDSHVKEIKTETKDNKIQNQVRPLEADTKFNPKSITDLNSKTFHCELCSKTLDREAYLRAHRNVVHSNVEWKCDFGQCSKSYRWYHQWRKHKMMHAKTKEFVCNICGKSFYRPDSLKFHEQLHMKEKKYRCELCPKSFTGHSALQSHIANNHGGPKPFKCPVVNCGTLWANSSQLNVHLISHQTEKSIKCAMCRTPKYFKTLGQLTIHQRRVHLEKTKKHGARTPQSKKFSEAVVFICSSTVCYFETVNETDVALHYNQQHGLPKVELLRNIGRPFAMSKEAQEMRSMIRKTYKCNICFKLFKCTATLSGHHQSVHANAASFTCSNCSKSFKRKDHLNRHIKNLH